MKYLYLFLLLLIPLTATAQVDIVREQGSGFYIQTADGDTLQLSGATPFYNSYHTAFEDALNWSGDNGGQQFYIRQNLTFRGSAYMYNEDIFIEEVVDTVYLPTDTLFVEVPGDTVYADTVRVPSYSETLPDHNLMIKNVSFDFDRTPDTLATGEIDWTENINFEIATQMLDTLYTEVRCGNEWVETNQFYQPADTLYYGIIWNCDSPLTYQMTATNDDGWREVVTNTYPLFLTEAEQWGGAEPSSYYTEFANTNDLSRWTQTWGNLVYDVDDVNNWLVLTLPERSIARVKWDDIPVHTNIRATVTEIVDSTHSTGIHMGLRSSDVAREGSVETYLNSEGLGVSIFQNGSWSNPYTFPVTWEYDVPITYTVELIDDTLTVMVGDERWTYIAPELLDIPAGSFMIGSTGAGIYYIDHIEIDILD